MNGGDLMDFPFIWNIALVNTHGRIDGGGVQLRLWSSTGAKAMEQYFNRLGPILSRPLALVGSSDVNASRMSD